MKPRATKKRKVEERKSINKEPLPVIKEKKNVSREKSGLDKQKLSHSDYKKIEWEKRPVMVSLDTTKAENETQTKTEKLISFHIRRTFSGLVTEARDVTVFKDTIIATNNDMVTLSWDVSTGAVTDHSSKPIKTKKKVCEGNCRHGNLLDVWMHHLDDRRVLFKWSWEPMGVIEPMRKVFLKGHTSDITHVGFFRDTMVVTSSGDGAVRFWNHVTGECVMVVNFPEPIRLFSFDVFQTCFCAWGYSGNIHFVDLSDYRDEKALLLLSARLNDPTSPFYKDRLPLELFKILFFMSDCALFKKIKI